MVGLAARVSCATPVLGPALGMLGIGLASAAAGQASRRTLRWYRGAGPHPAAWPPWEGVRREDLAVHAVAGLVVWRVRAPLHPEQSSAARRTCDCRLRHLLLSRSTVAGQRCDVCHPLMSALRKLQGRCCKGVSSR